MIQTEGLTHVHLIVSDLKRSLHFYKTAFGMEEQFWDGNNVVFLRTPGARDTITLNEQTDAKQIGRSGVDHIGFRLVDGSDLHAAIREAEAAGGQLIERGEHAPGHPFAYVADPDGYVIEL